MPRLFASLVVSTVVMGAASLPLVAAPSFDCAKAESSAERLICADAELAELDSRLAARYADAVTAAQVDNESDALSNLRASQRGWIKGRDECWKASDESACVAETMLRREAELVALWQLEAPRSAVTWACGDAADETIVTTFFDTELPVLRIEVGDEIDAGVQVPAASGARYEASFGRAIWIKGDEATYRSPDPDGTSIQCVTQ